MCNMIDLINAIAPVIFLFLVFIGFGMFMKKFMEVN